MIAPEGSAMPGMPFKIVTSEPVFRDVEVTFKPRCMLPSVLIPTDFPLDINNLIVPFVIHLNHGGSAQSFLETKKAELSKVTGKLISNIHVAGDEANVIGQKVLTPCLPIADFFKELERHLQSVRSRGFWVLFDKNRQLMSVMASILRKGDLTDVEYSNILNIGKFFQATGDGFLKQDTLDSFSLTIGRHCLKIKESDSPEDIQAHAAPFLKEVMPVNLRKHLKTLFPAQTMSSSAASVVEFSAAPAASAPIGQADSRTATTEEAVPLSIVSAQNDGSEKILENSETIFAQDSSLSLAAAGSEKPETASLLSAQPLQTLSVVKEEEEATSVAAPLPEEAASSDVTTRTASVEQTDSTDVAVGETAPLSVVPLQQSGSLPQENQTELVAPLAGRQLSAQESSSPSADVTRTMPVEQADSITAEPAVVAPLPAASVQQNLSVQGNSSSSTGSENTSSNPSKKDFFCKII